MNCHSAPVDLPRSVTCSGLERLNCLGDAVGDGVGVEQFRINSLLDVIWTRCGIGRLHVCERQVNTFGFSQSIGDLSRLKTVSLTTWTRLAVEDQPDPPNGGEL